MSDLSCLSDSQQMEREREGVRAREGGREKMEGGGRKMGAALARERKEMGEANSGARGKKKILLSPR